MEWDLLSNPTLPPTSIKDGVGCVWVVGLRRLGWIRMVPATMGRSVVTPPHHGQGAAANSLGGFHMGPRMEQPLHICLCDNQAVVACLHSRTSRERHIMHMLHTLAFVIGHRILQKQHSDTDFPKPGNHNTDTIFAIANCRLKLHFLRHLVKLICHFSHCHVGHIHDNIELSGRPLRTGV